MPWNYTFLLSLLLFYSFNWRLFRRLLFRHQGKTHHLQLNVGMGTKTFLILGSISDWTAGGVLIGCWRRGWCEKSTPDAARGVWANYGVKRLPFAQRNHPWSHCDWLGPSSAATPISQVIEACLRTSLSACIYDTMLLNWLWLHACLLFGELIIVLMSLLKLWKVLAFCDDD